MAAHRLRLRGRRVALVDDVMSAGSALRGTGAALVAVLRDSYELWTPAACSMCMAGQPLEDAGSAAV